jgi:hypothetical protein
MERRALVDSRLPGWPTRSWRSARCALKSLRRPGGDAVGPHADRCGHLYRSHRGVSPRRGLGGVPARSPRHPRGPAHRTALRVRLAVTPNGVQRPPEKRNRHRRSSARRPTGLGVQVPSESIQPPAHQRVNLTTPRRAEQIIECRPGLLGARDAGVNELRADHPQAPAYDRSSASWFSHV